MVIRFYTFLLPLINKKQIGDNEIIILFIV